MIVVDTNILVRLITKDDLDQTRQAVELLMAADRLWISRVVLLEVGWTLKSRYKYSQEAVSRALHVVVALGKAQVEDAEQVRRALGYFGGGMDLGDAFVLAFAPEGATVVTFDTNFVKRAKDVVGAVPTRLVEECLPPTV